MRESFGGPARWGGKRSVPVTGGLPPRGSASSAPAPPPEPEATDAAKALAAEQGVDLASVEGSGLGGQITKGDVQAALSPEPEPEAEADGNDVGEVEPAE